MYFVIGISIGSVIDRLSADKKIAKEELQDIVENMKFTHEIYEKSIEIKNELQKTIERYDDSFLKTLDVIDSLKKTEDGEVLRESKNILTKVLQLDEIYIYTLASNKTYIELVNPEEALDFEKLIRIDDHDYLKTVISSQSIFVNTSLKESVPTIVAPLFRETELVALIFIDEIEFENLNYQFMNTLKVLVHLISNRLSRTSEYIEEVNENHRVLKIDKGR